MDAAVPAGLRADLLSETPAGQTIFALASGAGRAAISVVRISGARSQAMVQALCGATLPPPRQASLRPIRFDGELIDHALVLWFPGPRSYTGEDGAELHLHGGPAVLEAVMGALAALGGRPAEAGEFTRRAVLNGRMDVLGAEAVADLVAAETAAQRQAALRHMDGAGARQVQAWRESLRRLVAWQEAQIDFSDEELPDSAAQVVLEGIAALQAELAAQMAGAQGAERLARGLRFVVSGPPNVGKSSLVNGLADSPVAIVTARPGTTRDLVSVRLVLGGVPVTLTDTAGLRAADDEIEAEGIARARAAVESADLVISVSAAGEAAPEAAESWLRVVNKIDLAPSPPGILGVSARTGAGMDQLRAELARRAAKLADASQGSGFWRRRHLAALEATARHLGDAAAAGLPDLRAEDLRLALRALGRLGGEVGIEEVLDTIFAEFCIGK